MNLKTLFGRRHRVLTDEVGDQILLCRYGHIYVHGPEKLGVATNGRRIGLKLAAIPGVEVWQDGDDDGMNLIFPVTAFDAVAMIIQPRRRRQLSEAARAAATERLKQFRPAMGSTSCAPEAAV